MNKIRQRRYSIILMTLVAWGLCGTARAQDDVALGTDYLSTQFGTQFNFGPGIGVVAFSGGTPCVSTADTVVERQADAIVSPGGTAVPIPIQLVCLSLKSIAPVSVGGVMYNVSVKLDPANLANDIGTATISENTAGNGGTFTSSLNVFFEADFTPVKGGKGFSIFNQLSLVNLGTAWSSTAPSGIFIVTGPDDNSSADQLANQHTGLASGEMDFYIAQVLAECAAQGGTVDCSNEAHYTLPAPTVQTGGNVAMGTDYLSTQFGTHFDFGPGIGVVAFSGGTPCVATADTMVERKADAIVSPGGTAPSITIQLVCLSLQSIAPVNVGGVMYNVSVKLDPANLANDTGTMIISENTAGNGGTFTSSLDVFFEADFTPLNGGQGFSIFNQISLINSGASWSSVASPGIFLVTGPDDGSSEDQLANKHTGLSSNEMDFYIAHVFNECAGQGGTVNCSNEQHSVGAAQGLETTRGNVALGTDYFSTQFGTQFDFGPGIGVVQFQGLALPGLGTADTVVERKKDAIVSPGGTAAPISIQLVGLSLQSITPVSVGGVMYNVFVTLDPANLAKDTGTLTISENTAGNGGGTFSSGINVFFIATFTPVSTGTGFTVATNVNLTSTGTTWSSTAPAGIFIVSGLDDNSSADQLANTHMGLSTNEVDFYPTTELVECSHNKGDCHIDTLALMPE